VLRQVQGGDACRGRVQEPPTGENHLYGMSYLGFYCQYFTCSFCDNILLPKKLKSQTVIRENLHNTLSYEKAASKGVNITNLLGAKVLAVIVLCH